MPSPVVKENLEAVSELAARKASRVSGTPMPYDTAEFDPPYDT
jgi:hypothetical protein